MAIYDLPTTLLIDVFSFPRSHIIAYDLNLLGSWANELLQQRMDDGLHAATQYDHGYVVLQTPLVEVGETRVELDVVEEDLFAFVERLRYAVEHLAEGVAEGDLVGEGVEVSLTALLVAEAEIVGHVVIACVCC